MATLKESPEPDEFRELETSIRYLDSVRYALEMQLFTYKTNSVT